MTLLTITQNVAKNCGIEPPTTALGNTDPDCVKLVQFANETGQELARRVDWSALRKSQLIEGTGFSASFPLPADYARLTDGWAVTFAGSPVRGGITADEWNSIVPVVGSPRYFQLFGTNIAFYPYPAEGEPVTLTYISSEWTSGGGATFAGDNETTLFPERLVEKGGIWRMKRHIGADYSDYLAEYEADLADSARFDGAVRAP